MSLVLHDLLTCCRRLENERATERRVTIFLLVCVSKLRRESTTNFFFFLDIPFQNEIENFKRLLRDPETVLQLDRNSDSRRGNQLNWDAVFR